MKLQISTRNPYGKLLWEFLLVGHTYGRENLFIPSTCSFIMTQFVQESKGNLVSQHGHSSLLSLIHRLRLAVS